MSALNEMRQMNAVPGPRCGWRKLMDSVTEQDAKDLTDAINSPDITYGAIARWLKEKRNISIREGVIGHHKRGGCTCQR